MLYSIFTGVPFTFSSGFKTVDRFIFKDGISSRRFWARWGSQRFWTTWSLVGNWNRSQIDVTACFDDLVACAEPNVSQSVCPEEECQWYKTFPGTSLTWSRKLVWFRYSTCRAKGQTKVHRWANAYKTFRSHLKPFCAQIT